jgi:hypothetical protein
MAKPVLDKQIKRAILEARTMMESVIKIDGNEAETRRRIERMFESLMGYDVFKHITREHAVHGVGDTEHCDFAIVLDENSKAPTMMVEVKRVSVEPAARQLKQAASYAINIGCEWVLLTNGIKWQLYHITFGQPPETILLDSWDLLSNDFDVLADKFSLIGYKNVKKGGLKALWEKSNVLTPFNVVKILLSEESISLIRRGIKKSTDVNVTPEEIVGAIRHLLNESALSEMEKVKICLPTQKPVKKVAPTKKVEPTTKTIIEQAEEVINATQSDKP